LGGPIGGHTGPVDQVVLGPDGRTLASAGDDHTVLLQSENTAEAVHRICVTTTGALTPLVWQRYVSSRPMPRACR
jgi:WD40 repeat protein